MSEAQNIQSFQRVTGVSESDARSYLDAAGWDVEQAISLYFDSPSPSTSIPANPQIARPSQPEVQASKPISQPQPQPQAQPQTRSPATRPPASGGIRTFSDLASEDPSKKQSYYTGGAKSGLEVSDPQAPKDPNDIVQQMMESAKRQGAMSASEFEAESKKPFGGAGFRLGSLPNTVSKPVPSTVKKEVVHSVTFWKQGISIDDGPLRAYQEPATQEFLGFINRGVVPPELGRGDIAVNMIDKKTEDYTAPPKKFVPFEGSGQSLASTSSPQPSNPAPVVNVGTWVLNLDETQPTTSIQVRFADGTRQVVKFNLTHTVGDIRKFVASARPSKPFVLLVLPNQNLTDDSQTIESAGLKNSVVVQRCT